MNFLKKMTLAAALSTALNVSATPIFNLFELGVAEQTAYNKVGEHNITTSLANEKGTLAMYSVKSKTDPNMAYMVEIYENQTAYEVHRKSPQYQYFLSQSPKILTDHKKLIALDPQFLADKKIEQTPTMRTNLVSVEVKPEFKQAFADVVKPEMAESMKVESGVLAMYAGTVKENPNMWYFFEIYQDDAAYQAHRATPHFQDYLKRTAAMIGDKQSVEIRPELLKNQGGLAFE